ncbi:hypothetical protein AAIP79_004444 [Klebsiella aerogenes]
MGRSIPVKIGQKEFKSKTAAVAYFMDQREAVKESGPIRDGQLFEELRVLYTRYCELTKWDLSNREIYAFSVDYEPRHTDQNYGSYLCYRVQFSPKDRLSFSLPDAVDVIAKAAAEHP